VAPGPFAPFLFFFSESSLDFLRPNNFDPHSLKHDLDRIHAGDDELFLTLPGFCHAKGDPEPDRHAFDRQRHKIVICEGLYLLHDQDGWEDIASVFDLKFFINSDIDVCMDRVKIRNQCIPGYTPEEIAERVDRVDRVNALAVLKSKGRADVVVDSLAMRK
jgi:pantothenate kinase